MGPNENTGGEQSQPIFDPYHTGNAMVAVAEPRARRERKRLRGALALAVCGVMTALTLSGGVIWGLQRWQQAVAEAEEQAEKATPPTRQAAHPSDAAADKKSDDKPELGPEVPQKSTERSVGTITVVDIGINVAHLSKAFEDEAATAKRRGQRLVVMLSGRSCAPCRGVDTALSDHRMQRALEGVRLVRVDLQVFREELTQMRIPHDLYPAFLLLGPDMRPIDGIHGGEWDEDVAENIAPVLNAFVRGTYRERRHHWSPVARSVQL
jgi:hypothetical protein